MSTVAKPPQLNFDELRRLKWLLGGTLALVSLWTVFFLDVEALGLVGVAGTVILATLLWPQLPGRVPPLLWKLSVPAIIVALVVDFYFSPDTLPVLIRLAILLVLYRAVGYRRKREDLQLIVLGLFLIVVAGVLTVSLGFAFLLLLFTACALGFLFIVNLLEAAESAGVRTPEAETAWTRLGWRKFFTRLRAVADWRLPAFATVLFTAVVVMSGVLFVLIPRFEMASGFFLDKYITRKSRTGFTDTIRFGEVGELIKDESVAMRVDLTDATGLRAAPYWRMVALDEYTPQGFRVSARVKQQLLTSQRVTQVVRGRLTPINRNSTVGGLWTVYLEPGVSRFLPLPGSFGILRLRDQSQVQTTLPQGRDDPARTPALQGTRLVALRTESMAMTAYQIDRVETSGLIPDPNFAQLLRSWAHGTPESQVDRTYDVRTMLQSPAGPANEAALRSMVREITGGETLPAAEFARRATAWLQSHHAYTLAVQLPPANGQDDIVRWLGSSEPGFCEYFAAGLAVLARSAGYPARVIAGFHGGVLNGFENYYMVRNSDAHAWVELYDGANAWLRLDPTPGNLATAAESSAVAARQALDSSWSARLDSLRVLWYRRIVSFDSRTQLQMFDQVKTFTADSGQALRSRLEEYTRRFRTWFVRPWDAGRLGRTAAWFAAVVVMAWAGARLCRLGGRRWQAWRRPNEYDPVRREAGRWLARLRRPANGRSLKSSDRMVSADIVADLHRLRYGRRETWPEPRAVFRRARKGGKMVERKDGSER